MLFGLVKQLRVLYLELAPAAARERSFGLAPFLLSVEFTGTDAASQRLWRC